MRHYLNKKSFVAFATLLPLLVFTLLFLANDHKSTQVTHSQEAVSWSIPLNDAVLSSGKIGTLTRQLYAEANGRQRADVLEPVIMQIDVLIATSNHPTSQLLTDLLRDLSLEHPDSQVRLLAYSAMITALENERELMDASDGLVSN